MSNFYKHIEVTDFMLTVQRCTHFINITIFTRHCFWIIDLITIHTIYNRQEQFIRFFCWIVHRIVKQCYSIIVVCCCNCIRNGYKHCIVAFFFVHNSKGLVTYFGAINIGGKRKPCANTISTVLECVLRAGNRDVLDGLVTTFVSCECNWFWSSQHVLAICTKNLDV